MPAGEEGWLEWIVNFDVVGIRNYNESDYPIEEVIMPVVTVEMWEGRTVEQKKQLVEDITSSFIKIGVPQEAVNIIIKDNPKHNWAIAGNLASEEPS